MSTAKVVATFVRIVRLVHPKKRLFEIAMTAVGSVAKKPPDASAQQERNEKSLLHQKSLRVFKLWKGMIRDLTLVALVSAENIRVLSRGPKILPRFFHTVFSGNRGPT